MKMDNLNMDDLLDELRAAHREPIDAAHYTAVRARVMAEIGRGHSPWRRLAWISGIGATALGLLFAITLRRPDLPPPPRIAFAIPSAPAAPITREREPRTVVAQARPAARPKREPVTVKLQTSDPNIVIYW